MEQFIIFIKSSLLPLIGTSLVLFVGFIFISSNEALVYDIVGLFLVVILVSNFISTGISNFFRQITRK
jgi:hypothetical protein